jgi:hypothetical protein
VTHVTKHDTEKEWESSYRDYSWIRLLVLWNTIGINNGLEDFSDLIRLDVSGTGNRVVLIPDHSDRWELVRQPVHDVSFFLGWSPEVSNESCVLHLHHVESLVKSFLFGDEHLVDIDCRNVVIMLLTRIELLVIRIELVEDDQLIFERSSRLIEHVLSIINSLTHSLNL